MWAMRGTAAEDRLDRAQTRRVLRRTAQMARPHRRAAVLAGLAVMLWTASSLAGPVLVGIGVDALEAGDRRSLDLTVVGYVGIVIASGLLARAQVRAVSRAGEGFLRDLRTRVFDHLQRQALAFFDREKAGVLISRMTADIESLGELVQFGLQQFLSAGLLIGFSLVVLLTLSWQLTLVCLVVLPVLVVASIRFQRQSNEAYLTVRDRVGQNLSALQESITGVRVIQAYAREPEQIRRFTATNRALYDAHMHSVRVSTWYFGLVEFAGIAATGAVLGVGGWLQDRGTISLGVVVSFVLLISNLFEPVQQLSQLFNNVQSAGAALAKLYGLLDHEPELADPAVARALPAAGALVLTGVGFRYGGAPNDALRGITLTVPPGERLALVGPTGAGKSTLAKLIARFYDPTTGAVTFGDVDLRAADPGELRRRIVVVPQEGFLFSGTLADNIRLARPEATDDELRAAVEAIGATERFAAFPDGLLTEVRERGSRLSAGERQLVSLARAAIVDPAVLILDEATSSLDPGTEAAVEQAMERVMRGRTVVVVAHRFSTVQRADRVGVIDDGELVELGPPGVLEQLPGGRYAALAAAWATTQPGGVPPT